MQMQMVGLTFRDFILLMTQLMCFRPLGIVWVIDSTDQSRMCVVQDEIETMLEHDDLADRPFPILFFANKVCIYRVSISVH